MPDFAVSTTFKGRDKLTGVLNKMGRSADKFGNSLTSSILKANVVSKGFDLMSQGVRSAAGEFIRFDDAITAAGARFKDIGPDSKNFEKDLLNIKKAARDAGAATEFSASQSAEALDFLAKAGFSSTEAIGSLNSMINLATATGEDFASVADMSSDLLGAFGMNADNAADKIKNLNRLNDVLVKTTNSANVTVETMFETMKDVGPIATGILGVSLEEVSALTAVLGNSGIKGSIAMTALKNAYLNLAAPTGKGADLLKEFNLTLDDGKGGAKKMTTLMTELAGKLQGLGKVKQAEVLDVIFGKRAIAGSKNILDNIANINKFEETLKSAAGTSQKTADIMRKSLGNRLKTLQSTLFELSFKFFTAFEKQGTGALDKITQAVRSFDMKPIIDGVKSAVTLFGQLYGVIQPIIPFLPVLIKGFLLYSVVLKGLLALNAAKNFLIFVNVLRQAAVAQGILNVVMSANPIGLIAVGISALIGVIVLLVRNWDTVVDVFGSGISKIWNWFSGLLDNPFFAVLSTLFLPFITIPALIIKHWAPIKEMFGSIGDKLSSVAGVFGFGGDDDEAKAPQQQRQAPNQTEIEARQQIGFAGKLQIAGAPEGSKVESKTTGAPPIDVEMLGQNI